MGLFDLVAHKPDKDLRILSKRVSDIRHDAETLRNALVSITDVNSSLVHVVEKIEGAQFTTQKEKISKLKVDDDYKKELIESIDNCKKMALDTLKPLMEHSSKLEGNMVAAEIKGKTMLVILEAQKKVVESGHMQLKLIKQIEAEGNKNSAKIKELVSEAEKINNITRNAVETFSTSGAEIDSVINTFGEKNGSISDMLKSNWMN